MGGRLALRTAGVACLVVGLVLAACSSSDPSGPDVDTDGDGLSDNEEVHVYGTSPLLQDTDGDGFTDYKEVVDLGFDPAQDPARFNPRVADLPVMLIVLAGPPVVTIQTQEANGVVYTIDESLSATATASVTNTWTNTNDQSNTLSESQTNGNDNSVSQDQHHDTATTNDNSTTNENSTTHENSVTEPFTPIQPAIPVVATADGGSDAGRSHDAGRVRDAESDAESGADARAGADSGAGADAGADAGAGSDAGAGASSGSSSGATQTTTDSVTRTNSTTHDNSTTDTNGTGTTVTFTNSVSTTVNPSTTFDTSFSFSTAQMQENSQTLTEDRSLAESHTITATGGFLKIAAFIRNPSNIGFQIANLILSATFQIGPTVLSVGNLDLDQGAFTTFVPFSLAPGESTGPVNFITLPLTLEEIKNLVATADALVIRLGAYELNDSSGKAFSFNVTDVGSRTALLAIDYGALRPPETYQVATNYNPGHPGTTAAMVFGQILHIPYTAGPSGLTVIRDVGVRTTSTFRWAVTRTHDEGPVAVTTQYGRKGNPYDFDAIELYAGDVLQIALVGPGSPAPADDGGSEPPMATGPDAPDGGLPVVGESLDAALQVSTPPMDASLPPPELPPDAGPQVTRP
jgi:hypothetical protein